MNNFFITCAPKRFDGENISLPLIEDTLLFSSFAKSHGFNPILLNWRSFIDFKKEHLSFFNFDGTPNYSCQLKNTDIVLIRDLGPLELFYPEILLFLEKIKCFAVNSTEVLRFGINKNYLLYLQKKGINIPKTDFQKNSVSYTTLLNNYGNEYIIKPILGECGNSFLKVSEINEDILSYKNTKVSEGWLVQKLIDMTMGEISMVFIKNKFSHAVLKKPTGSYMTVNGRFDPEVSFYIPSNNELAFAFNVINTLPNKPFYCRVDIVPDGNNNFFLMEVELLNPGFFWTKCDKEVVLNNFFKEIKS